MSARNDTVQHSLNHTPSHMINHSQIVLTNVGFIDPMQRIYHLISTLPSTKEFKIQL